MDFKQKVDVEIYRVRKSWLDFKSQVGTYFIFDNAVTAAKANKCNVYDGKKECVWNYKEENLCLN